MYTSPSHACYLKADSKHKKPVTVSCLGRSEQGVQKFPGYEIFYLLLFSLVRIILKCTLFLYYPKSKKEYVKFYIHFN